MSYDPFDAGDMYYQAKTVLSTLPDIEYNDGLVTSTCIATEYQVNSTWFIIRAERHIQAIADENYESGLEKGIEIKLINQVCKKLRMGQDAEKIAEDLVEDADHIQEIYDTALKFAPDYDSEKIYDALPKKALVKE